MIKKDIIIIGGGISGLYAALMIQKMVPEIKYLVIERNKEYGGRAYNEKYEGVNIVVGAGIGRYRKDKKLIKLMKEYEIPISKFETQHKYEKSIEKDCNVKKEFVNLKKEYERENNSKKDKNREEFEKYGIKKMGRGKYKNFVKCVGYSDYEKEDVNDVLYNYGMEDNYEKFVGFSVPWKELIDKMVREIGDNIINSTEVLEIERKSGGFELKTRRGLKEIKYETGKVIIATDIDTIKKLMRDLNEDSKIYDGISGQSFVRLYCKVSKEWVERMDKKIGGGAVVVDGILRKIIKMDGERGIYMIAYNDNKEAERIKGYMEDNEKNRKKIEEIIDDALGMKGVKISSIRGYYWKNGTHYYKPLMKEYVDRREYIEEVQKGVQGIRIVGEVVSKNQGWVEGGLESVKRVINERWIRGK
jgi:protoporphyrinogen oxidase